MTKLLRIEAINLRYSIDDTEDLSTRRAGSYSLLQSIRKIESEFKDELTPVSTGASIGLFEITTDKKDLVARVRQALRNKHEPYRHATFAIERIDQADFKAAGEKAIAGIRWQQMHSLNFTTDWGDSQKVCEFDEVRPADSEIRLPENKKAGASRSVAERHGAGRKLRQSFYKTEADIDGIEFTNDTASLSTFHVNAAGIPANLNGKMAIFYADGNGFGKIQQACQEPEDLQRWDKAIKDKRRQLLKDLIAWLATQPEAKNQGKLRFETLLWGGDECLFLLPAWLGLAFSRQFFALTADWAYPDGGQALRHAAGLVLAKHSAPISQMQRLAKSLANHGKANVQRKEQNTLSWVVLESFDHLGDNTAPYWHGRGIPDDGWGKLQLTPEKLATLENISPIKDKLPRSAMIRVLRALASGRLRDELPLIRRSYDNTSADLSVDERASLAAIWKSFGSTWAAPPEAPDKDWAAREAVPWTALLELWDYLPPANSTATTSGPEIRQ